MIRLTAIPWVLSLISLSAADHEDLLRFTNGDQLHGSFLGIKNGPVAAWRRDDVGASVDFKTTQIRHIVLHGGRPLKPLGSLSHIGLVNGDRIPGNITGIDAENITLDTSYAGVLHIPRKQVPMMAPNPLGGRVYYYGPFTEDDWKMTTPAFPDGLPAVSPDAAAKNDKAKEDNNKGDDEAKDDKIDDQPGRWRFSGSAWNWRDKHSGTALIHETGMPDRAVLRFSLSWKNRLSVAVGFHADFARPKAVPDAEKKGIKAHAFASGDATDLPRIFGNSYVLQMYSNYLMLYRTSISADGKPALDRVQMNNNSLRLGESGDARVEIRSNRRNGSISLFVNDEFVAQWSENDNVGHDGAGFAGKGPGFGFIVQGDDVPVRISDVVVTEWNGMPDSARSMQVEDQDVVLMANGTDRFAGRVAGLDDHGQVLFEGKHGQFHFPLEEIAEIRFAREHLAQAGDDPPDNMIVRLSPVGVISGRPVSGDGSMLGILSPVIGSVNLSTDAVMMLDFKPTNQIFDDWDADF